MKRLLLVLVTVSLIVIGCNGDGDTPTPTEDVTTHYQQTVPVFAAQDTVIRYNQSAVDRDDSLYPEIPRELWAEEITELNPQKVYYHNNNLIVLFEDYDETVNGIYVCVPISSYWPGDEETVELTLKDGSDYIFRIQQ